MAENFFGVTDAGKMRDNNEDAFIAENILDERYIAACVIDGVGGYEGGEIASMLAREAILDHLQNPPDDIIQTLKDSLAGANEKISNEKHRSGANGQMACVVTLALADIAENKFYYAHVGDTRLYLFRDNSLVKLTHDHSFVGFLEDSGRLTEEAAMLHPKRNEINKALGFDEEQFLQPDYVETGESPFLPGDTILLCSDGLSDMINHKVITSILSADKTLQEKCRLLIQSANDAGGTDNVTVVLVENDKSRTRHTATRPVIAKKKEVQRETRTPKEEEDEAIVKLEKNESHRKNTSVIILSVLLFVSLATLSWFVYHDYFRKPKAIMPALKPPQKKIDTVQLKLEDSINNPSAKEIFLGRIVDRSQPIKINDSITIQKDSLDIHGGGISMVADSAYRGAAFILPANCKYILIDSITLQNFEIGFLVHNTALHLKDVQFKNCNIPIEHKIYLPDSKTISGKIADSSFSYPDSVKLKH